MEQEPITPIVLPSKKGTLSRVFNSFLAVLSTLFAVAVLGILFFIFTLFGPRPWDKTDITIHDQSCDGFSLVFKEKRTINRIEGSSVSYLVQYVSPNKTKIIEYVGGNLLGSVDPAPVHTNIPVTVFENPGRGADREESTDYKTLYVNPSDFSKDEYEAISSCLEKNREVFHAAFETHLQKVKGSDRGANIYRSNGRLRIIGTAYADREDFYRYMSSNMERGGFEDRSSGYITIGFNGLVKGQYSGYIGNYFELIPENSTSSLKEFNTRNEAGVSLVDYLRRLALKGVQYMPASL